MRPAIGGRVQSRRIGFRAANHCETCTVGPSDRRHARGTIGASFNDEPLSRFGYWADWAVRPKWNLCNAPAKTVANKFLSASCVGRSTVGAPSARSVFSTSWNSRSTSSLRARPRTSWRPRRRRPGPQRSRASSAASRRASHFPSIYRANAWWCWGSRPARAADRRGCRRSART